MSWPGHQVLDHLKQGEAAVRFWERHAAKLTSDERRRITRGDYSAIVRPVEPEWEEGQWIEVASNLDIRITTVNWRRLSYRTSFDVRDFRVKLVRRVPQMHEPPERDESGTPIPHNAAAIEAARRDGNYTASSALAVTDAGEAVPDDFQRELTKDAQDRARLRELVEHPERVTERDLQRKANKMRKLQAEAKRKGIDITPELDKAIDEIQGKLAA